MYYNNGADYEDTLLQFLKLEIMENDKSDVCQASGIDPVQSLRQASSKTCLRVQTKDLPKGSD